MPPSSANALIIASLAATGILFGVPFLRPAPFGLGFPLGHAILFFTYFKFHHNFRAGLHRLVKYRHQYLPRDAATSHVWNEVCRMPGP